MLKLWRQDEKKLSSNFNMRKKRTSGVEAITRCGIAMLMSPDWANYLYIAFGFIFADTF